MRLQLAHDEAKWLLMDNSGSSGTVRRVISVESDRAGAAVWKNLLARSCDTEIAVFDRRHGIIEFVYCGCFAISRWKNFAST
jgi:hypothetical protein